MFTIFKRWAMALMAAAVAWPALATTYTQAPPMIANDVVRIRMVNSNRCLTMDTTAPYTARFSTCSGSYNMLFYVDKSAGWHNFRNLATNLCVTNNNSNYGNQPATGGACSLGASPARHQAVLVAGQGLKWYFLKASSMGYWECLSETAPNGQYGNGNPAGYSNCMAGPINDYVYVEHVDTFRLRHEVTSQCLYSAGNGKQVQSWGCWQDPAMAVRMEPVGGSDYRIRVVTTGQCLYGNPVPGGAVKSYTCWSDPNMVWTKQDLGNNRFQLQHKATGNCMYAGAGNGPIYNWPCWGDPAMVWVADPF